MHLVDPQLFESLLINAARKTRFLTRKVSQFLFTFVEFDS